MIGSTTSPAQAINHRCLGSTAETLRQVDKIFRYGGEELLAVLPQTPIEGATGAAERYRACVEDLAIPHQKSPSGVLTISLGVAHCLDDSGLPEEWAHVVSWADRALYRSKRAGKNCVSV